MVRAAKKRDVSQEEIEQFVNKANNDIKPNNENRLNNEDKDINDIKPNKRKRGNPRIKQTKTVSFSLPFNIDEMIDLAIEEAERAGYFGLSRSDIVVAALTSGAIKSNKLISNIKRIKGIDQNT